ncbi:DUF2637 domain-containing protein [Micromonospora sp. NPDC047548]|uniref:DUF2637 domain-containing protein n=1 Tax=Micromonospora sp. NPDC047548 TaxID=3155624 RepID=UPI0034027F7B
MLNPTTLARASSAAVVAGVAAVASYSHMRDLAAGHGQGVLLANLLPLSVDGMLIVASVVMADDRVAGRRPRLSAGVSFVVGVAASIAANVLAAPPSTVARVISAWPALALLLVVEMLARGPRSAPDVAEPASQCEPAGRPGIAPETAVRIAAAVATRPDADRDEVAAMAGVSTRTVRRYLAGQPA